MQERGADRRARARGGADRAGAGGAAGVPVERAASGGPADAPATGASASIRTSIDDDLQRALLEIARRYQSHLEPSATIAMLAVENDGRKVRAYVGSSDFFADRRFGQNDMVSGDPLAGLGAEALHLRHGVRRSGGASGNHDAGCRAALRRLCAEEFRRPFPRPDQRARGAAGLAQHSGGRAAGPRRPAALRAAAVGIRRAAGIPERGEAARPAGRARRRRHQPGRAGDALCRLGRSGKAPRR